MFAPKFSLRRVHWIRLVDVEELLQTLVLMCGCALSVMLLTLAVVLPTSHSTVGTVPGLQPQGGF